MPAEYWEALQSWHGLKILIIFLFLGSVLATRNIFWLLDAKILILFWPIFEISRICRFCNFLPFERIFRFSGNLFGISMSFFVKMADFLIPRVYTVFFENPAVWVFFRLTRKVFWSFWVPFSGSPAYYFGLCGWNIDNFFVLGAACQAHPHIILASVAEILILFCLFCCWSVSASCLLVHLAVYRPHISAISVLRRPLPAVPGWSRGTGSAWDRRRGHPRTRNCSYMEPLKRPRFYPLVRRWVWIVE